MTHTHTHIYINVGSQMLIYIFDFLKGTLTEKDGKPNLNNKPGRAENPKVS